MGTFTKYAARTGKIMGILTIPDDWNYYDENATLLFDGELDYATQYVVNGVATDRPNFNIGINKTTVTANGLDAIVLTNVPLGTSVNISGPLDFDPAIVEMEEPIEIAVALPGTYQIRLSLFPYKDLNISFEGV